MTGTSTHTRTILAASVCTALAVLTAGCGAHATTDTTTSDSPPAAAPGRVSVRVDSGDLTITSAVAHLDRSGDGSLTMSVRNDDGAPEHLGMVATPDGGRGVLVGGKTAEGNGSLSPAGIQLSNGTTVTFGGSGPHILLRHVQGVTTQHILPLVLQFGVAGLVRLQARVTAS